MARKVFFSFHYGRDLWRVNVVRNSGRVEGVPPPDSTMGPYGRKQREKEMRP